MKLLNHWAWLLSPPKFYGGGGSSTTTTYNQTNPQQEALANVAQQKWDYYQSKYVPLENKWISQVGNMDNQGNHNDVTGLTANTLKQNNGPQTAGIGDSMSGQRMGLGNYATNASTQSADTTNADIGVTNRMLQGEQGIVAMGTGQSMGAINGLNSVAEQSVAGQNANAKNAFDAQQATNGIYGTGAGMSAATLINKGAK